MSLNISSIPIFPCPHCAKPVRVEAGLAPLAMTSCPACLRPVCVPARMGDLTLLARVGQHPAGDLFDAREDLSGRKLSLLVCHPPQGRLQAVVDATVEVHRRLAVASGSQLARIHRLTFMGEYPVIVTEPRTPNMLKLPRHKSVSKAQARSMAHAVVMGMRQAKRAGLVHMGLHPGCVVMRPDGIRLTGFSPWNLLDAPPGGKWSNLYPKAWVPPEVAGGARPDQASDIWSVGAMLLYLATRQKPDAAEPPVAALRRLRPDLSQGFVQGVTLLMGADPASRPDSWTGVLDILMPGSARTAVSAALEQGMDSQPITDAQDGGKENKRSAQTRIVPSVSASELMRQMHEEEKLTSTLSGLHIKDLGLEVGNAYDQVRSLGTDAKSMLSLAADELEDSDGASPLDIMTRKVVDENEDSSSLGPGELGK